jgi:biotin transporter BioY
MLHLDSEQKRVLKAISGSSLGFLVGYPLLMWAFGKLGTWKEALAFLGIGILVALLMIVLYVLGSKIPKKDE